MISFTGISARADCNSLNTLPLGTEGAVGYDRRTHDMFYCDGVTWRSLTAGNTPVASSADCVSNGVGGTGEACCIGSECCITVNFPLAAKYRQGSGSNLYAISSTDNLGGLVSASVEISRPATGTAIDAGLATAAGLHVSVMQEANKRGCGASVRVCIPLACTVGLCGGNYSMNANFPFRRNLWVSGTGGYNAEQVTDPSGTYTVRTAGLAEILSRDLPTVNYGSVLATPVASSTTALHTYLLTDSMINVSVGNAANVALESHMVDATGAAINVRGLMTITRLAYLHPSCRR